MALAVLQRRIWRYVEWPQWCSQKCLQKFPHMSPVIQNLAKIKTPSCAHVLLIPAPGLWIHFSVMCWGLQSDNTSECSWQTSIYTAARGQLAMSTGAPRPHLGRGRSTAPVTGVRCAAPKEARWIWSVLAGRGPVGIPGSQAQTEA